MINAIFLYKKLNKDEFEVSIVDENTVDIKLVSSELSSVKILTIWKYCHKKNIKIRNWYGNIDFSKMNLGSNVFNIFPETIYASHINLSNNKIKDFKGNLKCIRYVGDEPGFGVVNLSNNNIESLIDIHILYFKIIDLSDNNISFIFTDAFEGEKELRVFNNPIKKISNNNNISKIMVNFVHYMQFNNKQNFRFVECTDFDLEALKKVDISVLLSFQRLWYKGKLLFDLNSTDDRKATGQSLSFFYRKINFKKVHIDSLKEAVLNNNIKTLILNEENKNKYDDSEAKIKILNMVLKRMEYFIINDNYNIVVNNRKNNLSRKIL